MIEKTHYSTIAKSSEGFYKEKGSKFIAKAFPVESQEQIKETLKELHKEHYDARHICYAYRIGIKTIYERANDDGEPNHSAGDPILGQIKSSDLTNTLIAVVRYFGGTKLGVGGLINAYRSAAQDALKNVKIEEKLITLPIKISFPYEYTNEVMRAIKDFEIAIQDQSFTDSCVIEGQIKESSFPKFIKSFELIDKIKIGS